MITIFKPLGETYKKTISNTIATLPTIPDGATRVIIQVETQDVRVKFNATSSTTYCATSGVGGGLLLPVNTVACPFYVFDGRDLMERMRLYRSSTGADGYINVIFQGEAQPPSYNGGLA